MMPFLPRFLPNWLPCLLSVFSAGADGLQGVLVLVGVSVCWWVLVGVGGCWWVLVGVSGC